MRRMLLTLGAMLLTGCGPNHLGGSIDGEGVGGARDAIWDTLTINLGPLSYEATAVVVTDFPDACGTFEDFFGAALSEFGCDDLCEAYVGVAQERNLGRDHYWSNTLVVNTSHGRTGTFDHGAALQEGEFSGTFNDYDFAPLHDATACEAACQDGELLVAEVDDSEEGSLELEDDGDLLRGQFDVGYGGDDGVSGRFVAERCDMGDWFF